jgi:hypothetical protein
LVIAAIIFVIINQQNDEVITSGEARKYWLHVPEGYDPAIPTPLIICIHGFAEWPAHQMKLSHWNELADEENFIVVYPRGSGFPLRWRTNRLEESMLDMHFIADLIDQLQQEYNIDQLQIYANGLFWPGGDPLPEWIVGHTSDDINTTQVDLRSTWTNQNGTPGPWCTPERGCCHIAGSFRFRLATGLSQQLDHPISVVNALAKCQSLFDEFQLPTPLQCHLRQPFLLLGAIAAYQNKNEDNQQDCHQNHQHRLS